MVTSDVCIVHFIFSMAHILFQSTPKLSWQKIYKYNENYFKDKINDYFCLKIIQTVRILSKIVHVTVEIANI